MVLSGELTLVVERKRERIAAGEVGLVPRGKRVLYRNDADAPCDYFSVCAPAFPPQLAPHGEPGRAAPSEGAPRAQHQTRTSTAPAPTLSPCRWPTRRASATPGRSRRWRASTWTGSSCATASCRSRSWETAPSAASTARGARRTRPRTCSASPPGTRRRAPRGRACWGTWSSRWTPRDGNAKEYERSLDVEMARYLAHGILHLLGHDHEKPTEARRMASLEERLLGGRGMVADGVPLKQRRARLV